MIEDRALEIDKLFDQLNKQSKSLGKFLDTPTLQQGQSQVPITYNESAVNDINYQLQKMHNEFDKEVTKKEYIEYCRHRKIMHYDPTLNKVITYNDR